MRLVRWILGGLLGWFDVLFPPTCAACGAVAWDEEGTALCPPCAGALPPPRERCPACGCLVGPGAAAPPCPACRDDPPGVDGVVARWSYDGTPRDLVAGLKFLGRRAAARPLAAGTASALRERDVPGDLVVGVPLSRRRLRERGYDQAREIAVLVARELGVPADPRALRRVRHGLPQTALRRAARRRRLLGGFRASRRRVAGRCVVLVDDVLTTGGTARACARALRRAGALSIVVAVACRTERLVS